jgi:hypothetical protein
MKISLSIRTKLASTLLILVASSIVCVILSYSSSRVAIESLQSIYKNNFHSIKNTDNTNIANLRSKIPTDSLAMNHSIEPQEKNLSRTQKRFNESEELFQSFRDLNVANDEQRELKAELKAKRKDFFEKGVFARFDLLKHENPHAATKLITTRHRDIHGSTIALGLKIRKF